ncbi:MAG: RsmB/NOP family class I SAM-dependent RNA methyltransferase, partial [Hyphomicrobiaceae bacterium]
SRTFDEAFAAAIADGALKDVESRDRAFARLIAITTLRRLGQVDDVLGKFLIKPLDKRAPFARAVLQTAVTQLLFLDVPPHAVIDVAVQAIKSHRKSQHFAGLTNAVLRRVSEGGATILAEQNAATLNTPPWMMERWRSIYGDGIARAIAEAHLGEPALDVSLKDPRDAGSWAERLGAMMLSTGSLRLEGAGRIEALAGYDEGAWWVQDAAAALPVKLLGDVAGADVLDLCSAPGGKTAQLCATGARVTSLDNSAIRMKRVEANLKRLGMTATLVVDDATTWTGGPFDAVLLDAPCSATGTIRRHPDLPYLKTEADITELAVLQRRLLHRSADLLKPCGRIVFCTCSLEPEEGPAHVSPFLAAHDDMAVDPIDPAEHDIPHNWVTSEGYLRTLPNHAVPRCDDDGQPSAGVDGFFSVRFVRSG